MATFENSDNLDEIFQALAHPIRRQILDFALANPGCMSGEISEQFDVSRITIVKHIKVLAKANLIVIENEGRARHHYFNPIPIEMIYQRWTTEYSAFFSQRLTAFKRDLEQYEDGTSDEKTA